METRHIRLTNEDSLIAKKALLSSEINLLQMIKRISVYRSLRKKEFAIKNKLKVSLGSVKSKLNNLLSTFPEEGETPKRKTKKRRKSQIKEAPELTEELEDIQAKLAKLS